MRSLPMLVTLAFSVPGLSAQQPVSAPADPGPAVRAIAPGFQTSDQNGKSWTLQQLMGPKGLMLVFFRSADW
jgi:hypothetical protein